MERRMVPTASPMWGWIAGGAFILVVLALIFSAGEGSKTASTQPPSTTGQGTR
jgi:TRAP-type C4-dicarboxylate transport system permease large subunit